MNYCFPVNLSHPMIFEKTEEFLSSNGLQYEPLDVLYVVANESYEWIACAGRSKNVLKCFAVDPAARNSNAFDELISALIKDAYQKNIEELFVFTKNDYLAMFESFGFTRLASTESSGLLFRSDRSVESILEQLAIPEKPGRIGSIVMNANPFTNGHRYLIETAASKVDHLIVFVVENDASYFNTADRYALVKSQTRDLDHVTVVLSTEFIISKATFPSYFLKETALVNREHARIDALIFKRYFVPLFHIGVRFLGEEPLDPSTAIYNEELSLILPPECSVDIIPRLCRDDEVVSASDVRRHFQQGDLESIRAIVPEGTFQFLKDRHEKHIRS